MNQYAYLSQLEANRRLYLRNLYRREQLARFREAVEERLLCHPTEHDIADGDALNAAVTVIRNHGQAAQAPGLLNGVVPPSRLSDVSFFIASSGLRINLHQLLTHDDWPIALRDELYAADRDDFQSVIAQVIKESRNAGVTHATLEQLDRTLAHLSRKLDRHPVVDFIQYSEAKDHMTRLADLARALRQRHVGELLADLKSNRARTLGELIKLMSKYNLRFAPAGTPRQRQAHLDFYPILAAARDQVLARVKGDEGDRGPAERVARK